MINKNIDKYPLEIMCLIALFLSSALEIASKSLVMIITYCQNMPKLL